MVTTARVHFALEEKEDKAIAISCYDLGSERPFVKKYEKYINHGYMPIRGEGELRIEKTTMEELIEHLEENYPNYRCVYIKLDE